MLVWHDTQRRAMARPEWLPERVVRVHHERGDLLCVGDRHAALLGWRDEVAWADAGDGWAVASYGDPCIEDLIRPDQHWTLAATVVDSRGRSWLIPALLAPSGDPEVPGACLATLARRLTATGWVREALHQRQQHALEAVQSCFPHLDDLGNTTLDQQGSWIGALLDATYFGGPLSFAVLGLIDDTVVRIGLRIAAGRVDDYLPAGPR